VVTDGDWHRATIDSAVAAGVTARTGEEAVRVAYALARAEGLVSATTANAAVHAAALARDRRLAVEDAGRLMAASRGQETYDALDLVPTWRDARRLRVEMPLMADALAPNTAVAVQQAERLLAHVRRASAALALPPVDSAATPGVAAGGPAAGAGRPRWGCRRRRGAGWPRCPACGTPTRCRPWW
jgi:hypothetical protein